MQLAEQAATTGPCCYQPPDQPQCRSLYVWVALIRELDSCVAFFVRFYPTPESKTIHGLHAHLFTASMLAVNSS